MVNEQNNVKRLFQMRKNVILIPSNTDLNRGDEALVWESISIIKDVYDDNVNISIVGSTDNSDTSKLQTRQTQKLGYEILETLLKHPGRYASSDDVSYSKKTILKWGWVAIKDLIFSLLLLSKCSFLFNIAYKKMEEQQRYSYSKFKEADSVFVKGGGFLHSYGGLTDAYKIYYFLYLILLSQRLGKKVYVLPNSIGPLKNSVARYLVKKILRKCSLVTTRESISQHFVKSIGISSFKFPDLGFYLKPSEFDFSSYLKDRGVDLNKTNVLFTLRPYRFDGAKDPKTLYSNYEQCVINTISYLDSKNIGITFFAHTLGPGLHEDDRVALLSVLKKLPENLRIKIIYISDDELTCRDVEKIYSYYDYVIGTRFHSVIFSLNVNIPSIAIAYGGNKGKGIMEDLNNNMYSIDIDKLNKESLIEKLDCLFISREEYLNNLSVCREYIKRQREILVSEIRKTITSNN